MNDNIETVEVNNDVSVETPVASVKPQRSRGRPVDPNSGLARARALYSTLPEGSSRKDVVAAFQTLGLSKDTSAAYYSVVTRKAK